MKLSDREGFDEGCHCLGRDDEQPVGLALIGGQLGQRNLLYETPADAVSPVSRRILALICSAILAEAISFRLLVTSR